jgi:hypothetical protein
MITRSIGRSQSASSAGEQAFGVGLVDEHVQPAAGPAQDVAGDERRVLANQEDDLLRLAVEFDASTPRGSSSIVAGLDGGAIRRAAVPTPTPRTLDDLRGSSVVCRLCEQHANRLAAWVEAAVARQERVDQNDLVVRLVAHHRDVLRPVLGRLPASVVEVARQAGHSPAMTLSTYGHVIEELEGADSRSAEAVIRAARDGSVAARVRG